MDFVKPEAVGAFFDMGIILTAAKLQDDTGRDVSTLLKQGGLELLADVEDDRQKAGVGVERICYDFDCCYGWE